jgi:hypothetical protein
LPQRVAPALLVVWGGHLQSVAVYLSRSFPVDPPPALGYGGSS